MAMPPPRLLVLLIYYCISCCCQQALVAAAAAVAAAKQLSCDFDQHHACQYTLQGWLMEPVENTGILCVIPERNGYLLYAFTQYPTAHSLHLCLLFNYRLTPDRRGCVSGQPRLIFALDNDVHWSLDNSNADDAFQNAVDASDMTPRKKIGSAGWTGSQVSLSVRRNQSRLRIDACGVCLDNLTAFAGRCPIDAANLNWGLRLVAMDPRLWLAPFIGLASICLAVGLVTSMSMSRRYRRSACCCCCSYSSASVASAAASDDKKRRRRQTPRTPPPPPMPQLPQAQRPHSQLLLLGPADFDNPPAAASAAVAGGSDNPNSDTNNSRVALRLSAQQQQSSLLESSALPETSASACGSRGHRPLSIPATCTFVMSAERYGAPTPQPTPVQTPTASTPATAPVSAHRQHSTSLSLSCPGKDLELFRDPDASSCSDVDDEDGEQGRLLGAGGGGVGEAAAAAPTVPRRFSPTSPSLAD